MKSIILLIATGNLLRSLALAQPVPPRYKVTDLATLPGSPFTQATYIHDDGMITGLSTAADGSQHSVFWYQKFFADFGAKLLGGPNSGAFGFNGSGQADGIAETADKDPNNENFCAYGTGLKCLPFRWQNGVATALPLLGGNNGTIGTINKLGEIVGVAETGVRDGSCPKEAAFTGVGPLVFDFAAVVWGPGPGQIRQLRPLPGDTVSEALFNNDNGEVVGASGTCATTSLPPIAAGPHAVLWDKNGTPHDLGNLGGDGTTAQMGAGNIGLAVNNRGQVTGASAITGNATNHAYIWTSETGMRDLGTLPGDVLSVGTGINDESLVIGSSMDKDGNPTAVIWANGAIIDLNSLVPEDFPLFLLFATAANNSGQIVGFGVQKDAPNHVHGFLATPDFSDAALARSSSPARRPAISGSAREELQQQVRFGKFMTSTPQ